MARRRCWCAAPKADPEGRGATVYLARDSVGRVREWIQRSGVCDGRLFRSLCRGVVGEGLDASPGSGCLREGAKSYGKGLHVERGPARGHRYSPVRLMCSHPSGETWPRNSAGTSRPAFFLVKTASQSFSVFPVDDDRGQQVEAGDPVVLSFLGSVSQFAALVEVDGALEGMVSLALVQSDLGASAHVGVRGPVDHEQRAFDAADLPQGGRQLVLAGIRGELAQDQPVAGAPARRVTLPVFRLPGDAGAGTRGGCEPRLPRDGPHHAWRRRIRQQRQDRDSDSAPHRGRAGSAGAGTVAATARSPAPAHRGCAAAPPCSRRARWRTCFVVNLVSASKEPVPEPLVLDVGVGGRVKTRFSARPSRVSLMTWWISVIAVLRREPVAGGCAPVD